MSDPRASDFWQAAIRSGLMDVESLTACWDAIHPANRDQSGAHRPQAGAAGGGVEIANPLAGAATAGGTQRWV